MKFNITKILSEWAYRVDDGQPDVTNTDHVNHLREILYNFGLPHKFIVEYVYGLTEANKPGQTWQTKSGKWAGWKAGEKRAQYGMKTGKEAKAYVAGKSPDKKKDTGKKKTKTERSPAGIHGNLSDGDNQEKNDILIYGVGKDYEKATGKKAAPGIAGSAFNEIVTGEGQHILAKNPNMTEEELAQQMFDDFGSSKLGQDQSYSAEVKALIPDKLIQARKDAKASGDKDAIKKAEQDIATMSKCIVAAKSAKQKHNRSEQRVKALQDNGKFGKAVKTHTFYGAESSKTGQKNAIDKAVKSGGKILLPNGQDVNPDVLKKFIDAGGKGANPSDTATFVEDEDGNLLVQFHSDKTSTDDPTGSLTLNAEMEQILNNIDTDKDLDDNQRMESRAVAETFNETISKIENNYKTQTISVAEELEQLDIDTQVDIIESGSDAKGSTLKDNVDKSIFGSKGTVKEKYLEHIPKGADPENLTTKEKYQMILAFVKTGNGTNDDIKVVNKIGVALSKQTGNESINPKKALAKRREEVVNLQRERRDLLNEIHPGLGDRQEANGVIDSFHLSILDEKEYNKEASEEDQFEAIVSQGVDVHMGGTVIDGDVLRKSFGVKNLEEFKENFGVQEKEEYQRDGQGNITGKVVFMYTTIVDKEGKKKRIPIGKRTFRSSDGPTGKTRTIYQWAPEFQQIIKDSQ